MSRKVYTKYILKDKHKIQMYVNLVVHHMVPIVEVSLFCQNALIA